MADGGEVLSTAATVFRRRAAATEGWTSFSSQLRIQWKRRRPKATIDDNERRGWRSEHDGNPLVHGEIDFRRGFGARGTAAGVALTLAKPREVTGLTGDGRGDGARRLERRPEVEREGARGEAARAREKLGKKRERKRRSWDCYL
uniref:DUF834 domain-containing protein n=2 Tax=Oryza sativa subsp. japonica TaxID=39947 RepID=Q2R5X7_ORYSJ|nr:hypothetical protein LOC_Os11g23000 [Oryza sativa Japonica Group]ABA93087.1 hypothetical protein LOC_Os11g23000 [Oryza sativa Japonica Group]